MATEHTPVGTLRARRTEARRVRKHDFEDRFEVPTEYSANGSLFFTTHYAVLLLIVAPKRAGECESTEESMVKPHG